MNLLKRVLNAVRNLTAKKAIVVSTKVHVEDDADPYVVDIVNRLERLRERTASKNRRLL